MKSYKNVFNDGYNYRGFKVTSIEELDQAKRELFANNEYYNSLDLAKYSKERKEIIEDYYIVEHLITEGAKAKLRLEKIHNTSLALIIYNTAKDLFDKTNLQLEPIGI